MWESNDVVIPLGPRRAGLDFGFVCPVGVGDPRRMILDTGNLSDFMLARSTKSLGRAIVSDKDGA